MTGDGLRILHSVRDLWAVSIIWDQIADGLLVLRRPVKADKVE